MLKTEKVMIEDTELIQKSYLIVRKISKFEYDKKAFGIGDKKEINI